MPKISRAKLLAAATTVLVLLLACNLELLPLALLVDAIGLDVLALLLGAQLVAVLPWLRARTAAALRAEEERRPSQPNQNEVLKRSHGISGLKLRGALPILKAELKYRQRQERHH